MRVGVHLSRMVLRGTFFAATLAALTACTPTALEQSDNEPANATDVVRNADLSPRYTKDSRDGQGGANASKGFSLFGSGAVVADASQAPAPDGASPADDGKDGFTLNFENSPIANVAKVVLGDILGVGYVIDPRAQGTISLSSGRPIGKKDMLFTLESALRANNLVMVRGASGYRIAPATDAGTGSADVADGAAGVEPGYGTTVIPLRYVSGATLSRLLEGFAARPGAIRSDPTGGLLVVVGSGAERQSALDTVRSFDVDWMRGQSVGMYPLANSAPDAIIPELEKIMDSGDNGRANNLVKFQAVARQNAVLVVAARPQMLKTAQMWIARLDSPNSTSEGVKVYRVRYGDAKTIAQLLNDIYVGSGSGAGASDSAANQIAPASGATTLTPTQRLTGGAPPAPAGGGVAGGPLTGGANAFGGVPSASNPTAALASALSSSGSSSNGPLLPGVRITADASNNSLLIYASAASYRVIQKTLDQLDRPKLQVAIDVTIAEVTLNDKLNYGVQFFLSNQYGAIINSATGQPTAATAAPAGFNLLVGNSLTPHAIINALHDLTDVKILSNPSLVVVDNGVASLEVGDQVPVSTGSATVLSTSNTVVSTVDYKNTGIILNVKPRVNSNGNVMLDIEQEISAVPEGTTTLTPTISQRKVKSEISVASGQMVLLAGLISATQTKDRSGIPVLDQLPLIGGAFSTTGTSKGRTELIILIRPQIIRDGADAATVAEELRSKMRGGKMDALYLPDALNVNAKGLR